jgi:hypothetical protein
MRGRFIGFLALPNGRLHECGNPFLLNRASPTALKEEWGDLRQRICKAYMLTCVSVPPEEIRRGAGWESFFPFLLMNASGKGESSGLYARCTYEGTRQHEGRPLAQIALQPKMKELPGTLPLAGQLSGKVYFSVDHRYIARADLTLENPIETLEVHLTRSVPAEYRKADRPQVAGLVPRAVTLRYKYDVQGSRTVKLLTRLAPEGYRGGQARPAQCLEAEAVETRRPDAKGTKYKLHMGSVKAWTEMDGRKTPLQLPADKLLAGPQANAYFPVRPDGTVLERSTDDLAENDHPENLRRKFAHLLNRIANGYELTCLPAPVAEMRPGTTWGTKLTTQMVYADTTQLVDIVVRCVYEGLRVRDGQRQASIALQGRVEDGTTFTIVGRFSGSVQFAVDDGFVTSADTKLEMANQTLEVHLTRSAGKLPGTGP